MHLAPGSTARLRNPHVRVAGRQEVGIGSRVGIDVPAVASSVGVEGDGCSYGLAYGTAGKVGDGDGNGACIEAV